MLESDTIDFARCAKIYPGPFLQVLADLLVGESRHATVRMMDDDDFLRL